MDKPSQSARSELFTIRVWEEEIAPGRSEWRGKIQLVRSGDVRYFREWGTLASLLLTMLGEVETEMFGGEKP